LVKLLANWPVAKELKFAMYLSQSTCVRT